MGFVYFGVGFRYSRVIICFFVGFASFRIEDFFAELYFDFGIGYRLFVNC